ncbi:MAG: hypothetical protein A3G76_03720 [Acidobacteria bacterium RIFCSPLOWO2_12_FULL_65_11]|nr:MAG: hypothetical protein A3H95_07395 [Acidobacteria bacterium RIFCSPLOWO2_02_FULL_64_15]OFW30036.1 MAG: hypothetical protein A3G76_03720 [Acidobacteria bacterium RIFCSPLOWO2_12_FULL_65_11]
MNDQRPAVSADFVAFEESLDPDTRAFLDKLRGQGVRRSQEEELRWLCEQHREGMEDARAIAARLRRHDGFRFEIEALAERLQRVEEIVSRFKMTDEGR